MTVRKFIALTSAALAAVAVTASAEVAVDVTSAYIFRGATVNDEVNVQPGFETTAFGDAIGVGTWANFNTDSSEFDEIDYYFSYSLPMGDSPVSVDIGYTEYTYPTAAADADREPFISFGYEMDAVETSLLLAYGVDGGIEDSFYGELGLGLSLLSEDNVSVSASAALGYVDPDSGESGFSHLTLGLGVDLAIPESDRSVSASVNYVVETDEDVLVIDEEVFFVVGTTL